MRYYRVQIVYTSEGKRVTLDTQHYEASAELAMAMVCAEECIAADEVIRWRVTEDVAPRDGRREVRR